MLQILVQFAGNLSERVFGKTVLWIWIISSLIIQAIKPVHFRLSSGRVVRFLIELKITRQNLLSCFHSTLNLNLSIFLFFQSSLNSESSLGFFSAEFSVEFSFSWIFFQLNFLGRTSVVDFHCVFISWEASFKKQKTKPICWLIFPAFKVRSSNSYRGFN